MKFSDIKKDIEIVSSLGGIWKAIKKIDADSWLIKRSSKVKSLEDICVLSKGQARQFSQRIYIKKIPLRYSCQRRRTETELIISNLKLP